MGSNPKSHSNILDATLRKLFPKRRSSLKRGGSQSSWCAADSSPVDEHNDGFYKYSQEVLEQERRNEIRLRSSNSTAGSYTSAVSWPSFHVALMYLWLTD